MTTKSYRNNGLYYSSEYGGMIGTAIERDSVGSNSVGPRFSENSYSMTYNERTIPGVTYVLYDGSVTKVAGNFGSPVMPPVWTDNDMIALINNIDSKMRGSDFNLGVSAGEGGKTIDLIAQTAMNLAKAARNAKRGNFKKAAENLGLRPKPGENFVTDTFASRWLELQYGWKPLLNDVKNAAESLAFNLNKPQRTSVRSSQSRFGQDVLHNYNEDLLRFQEFQVGIIVRLEEEYDIVDNLHLADPELIGWELMPYSFVVDWFLPIGAWLEARAAVRNTRGVWIVSTKRTDTFLYGGPGPNPYIVSTSGASQYFCKNVQFTRGIGPPSIPLPKFKSLGDSLNLTKLITSGALLAGAFR